MSKIAILADEDLVLGFRALGVSTYPVTNREEVFHALREVIQDKDISIAYITEKWAVEISELIEELSAQEETIIVVIPDHRPSSGWAKTKMRKAAIKAVGADTLFK